MAEQTKKPETGNATNQVEGMRAQAEEQLHNQLLETQKAAEEAAKLEQQLLEAQQQEQAQVETEQKAKQTTEKIEQVTGQ